MARNRQNNTDTCKTAADAHTMKTKGHNTNNDDVRPERCVCVNERETKEKDVKEDSKGRGQAEKEHSGGLDISF